MDRPRSAPDRMVRVLQWAILGGFVLFVGGIVAWIVHLIRTAWRLGDVPSASIGISLVAIPVFVVLLGVIIYVFCGLLGDQGGEEEFLAPPVTRRRNDRQGEAGCKLQDCGRSANG